MLNKGQTLFVFEGSRTEDKVVQMLERNFLGEKVALKCVYDAEIYQLYRRLKDDDFALDVVNLLKERSPQNAEKLKDCDRDTFAYIYLFFDYDGHSTLADDDKIIELLDFFDNETDNGMLYISYPMVEAIRHFKDMESFKTLTVKCKRQKCIYQNECLDKDNCFYEPHYKAFVSTDCRPQLVNVNSFTREVWNELILAHLYKMNYLINDEYVFPISISNQLTVFNKQQEKHINQKCPRVAVLSAFPMYVLDYYGVNKLKEKLIE